MSEVNEALHVPATVALLTGWCGRVLVDCHGVLVDAVLRKLLV